jgi:RNA polymerase sigma-70 factor (ECF subfamily)
MTLRVRRRRAEVSLEPPSESGEPALAIDVRDRALNPEQLYDQRQRCYFALHAMSKLDNSLRTPMTIWIERECSIKELARTLDLSVTAVKSRLHRARKRLARSRAF